MCSGEMARLPSRCTGKPGGLKTPAPLHSCTYHVQFLSISYHGLHIRTNAVWKWEFNGYCNECWLNRSEKQEEGDAGERREVCLGCSGVVGFSRGQMIWWKRDYFFFFPRAFPPLYTRESSRTRRQGAPLIRIIRRFFTSDKQAIWLSSGLFEENMFLCHTPGSPTSGKSRSPLSTWHCFYAFVNIKANRLGQFGTTASLSLSWPSTWHCHLSANLVYSNYELNSHSVGSQSQAVDVREYCALLMLRVISCLLTDFIFFPPILVFSVGFEPK